jgi:hypothetical protein
MDLNFEQLLAQHNQEFKEAEVYSNWMPDDGEYIVSIVKFDKGISTKDRDSLGWWKLTGRIEDVADEKLNGREFPVGYYTSKAYGILKGAARILSGNSELNDLAEAHAILEASPGSVLRVKVRTSISKKNGKEYTNCFILDVINTTTETSAEDVSNVTTPAPIETPVEAPVEAPVEVPAEVTPTA